MLEVKDICVSLGRRPVLSDLSLRLAPGEVVAVIGPNGAGKSTLLSVMAGARQADSGTALLDGAPLASVASGDLARKRAVLSQSHALSFDFAVRDVVELGRAPYRGRPEARHDGEAIDASLAFTGAAHLAERRYTTLSGGEKQRVQFARVLAQIWRTAPCFCDGRYLLLDEPTNNLDLAHQHGTLTLARELASQGAGVLAVLHDPNLASLYADRVVLLERGRIQADGSPQDVFRADLIEAVYGMPVSVLPHPSRGCPQIMPA
jgi:iron complex transport system ATP-binding protein